MADLPPPPAPVVGEVVAPVAAAPVVAEAGELAAPPVVEAELKRKIQVFRLLEQEKALETTEGTLTSLRRYLNRPSSAFDPFEALDLLQALVRLARTQAHLKADEYAAALDEVRARWDSLSPTDLQRLMLGLLGDPVRAKIAKEADSILKTASKVARPVQAGPSRLRPSSPYVRGPCYNCGRFGHLSRSCRAPRAPPILGRGRGAAFGRGRGNTRY
ncbi:hypothetical protein ACROYT_G001354 [Oculina patagonica]